MGAELPDRSTLIKAQFSVLDTAAERGTSDELHTCVHAHNLRILIRIEAADCDGMR